ncbi:MAG TPA: FliA/WhiG family RNA polymerase sigma factor [Acidimicrobiales bacterium]|nr:FliA/WhiG family RNA polymerase sigma factor [Acidimicrobiales bacterium]
MSQTGTDRLQSVEELWAEFKSTADRSARDRLILHYSPLVKYVAGRVAAAMPNHVDYADLVSYGILGLIDAIEKFDPSRAIKFETYGVPRVRGAILDELRSIDWVPRSVRAKARAVDSAFAKLEGTLGRSPTDRELADELEMTTDDLDDILRQTSRAGLLQLDDVLFRQGGTGGQTLGDTLQDQGDAPGATIELEETRRQLAKAIQRLGDRERKVLTLYYYEGLNLAEIGDILGVTESRACQIHTKAVLHLRQRLRDELT